MAILRRVNWISQERVDLPDLRSIESAASNDFDDLIKSVITGTSQGYFVRGFNLSMVGAINNAASSLQLIVDPGAILHINASQSGTIYLVPTGTPSQVLNAALNPNVQGSFTPNAINYVGLDYVRFLDAATDAQVYIWDPTTNQENTQVAPRAQLLNFTIVISTTAFPANILPIATVQTDASNNAVDITDDRWLLGRLGTGGTNPNPFYTYPWPQGRTENPPSSSDDSIDPFSGGDKAIGSLKDWMNAIMSSLLEIKGTNYWYSVSNAGSLESLREDLGNTVITGRGHITHSDATAGLITWDQDINIKVVGSELTYALHANPSTADITLTEDQVAYIDLVRDAQVTPNLIWTYSGMLGYTTVTSVGNVAWTGSLQSGDFIKYSSSDYSGYFEIDTVVNSTTVHLVSGVTPSTGATGIQSEYAYGTYYTSSVAPNMSRSIQIANRGDVPLGQNIFWLMLRTDNGGATPKVYVRFLGAEIDQGVTEEISDNKSQETLQYIGAPLESSYLPQYVSSLDPGSVPQITQLTFGDASTITASQYFLINSSNNARMYYVWFNKDGSGADPRPPGNASVEVFITTGMSAIQVAAAVSSALNATLFSDFLSVPQANPNQNVLVVTNKSAGTCTTAGVGTMPSPFAISILQSGTGLGNNFIDDGDSLTLGVKKLDDAIGTLIASLNQPQYDDLVTVVASGAVPPGTINGPVAPGTLITLPLNSAMGDIQQQYEVGKNLLQIFLNGQCLINGIDWAEVGADLSLSIEIEILIGLVVGDVLEFRISVGGSGGGGVQGPPGPQGPTGPQGADAINGPVNISTKVSNYTLMSTDGFILANANGGSFTLTLPSANAPGIPGKLFYIKKIDSSANTITIQAFGVQLIDNVNSITTNTPFQEFSLVSDSTQYWLI